jgi:hypothetical protein
MASQPETGRAGRAIPRPVGWQNIVNPKLTRRGFLAGTAALPIAAETSFADSPVSMDLEFDLSADGATLTVREFPHPAPGQKLDPNARFPTWQAIAAAFGPQAWFDFTVDADDDKHRHLRIRKASYGAANSIDLELFFSFVLAPDKKRIDHWTVELTTDLWRSATKPGSPWTSGRQAFRDFAQKNGNLNGPVNAANANVRLGQMLDRRVATDDKTAEALKLAFRNDCLWGLSRDRGVAATSFDGLATAGVFTFGWHQVENEAPFLLGSAKNDKEQNDRVKVHSPFGLGGTSGVSVSVHDFAASGPPLAWEVRQIASPLVPKTLETFAKLTFGTAQLTIADDDDPTAAPIPAASLFLTECRLPIKDQRVRRTLWGAVAQTDAPAELRTSVGRLGVNAPEPVPAPTAPGANAVASPPAPNGPATPPAPPTPAPGAPSATNAPLDTDSLIAGGDRTGAQDATIWAVFDRMKASEPYAARRIAVDLALFSSDLALPDVSHSALTFDWADFRLVYEDGEPMKELSAGEFPRPPASNYLWVGPRAGATAEVAHFDLSRATLAVARDVDLVKLRFRFLDLTLALTPEPIIRSRHADCRVIDLGNGHFRDDRPVLVADFDPQHVFEEAIFRQNIPLPDIADKVDVTFPEGVVNKDQDRIAILNQIKAYASDLEKLVGYRKAVQAAKIDKDPHNTDFKDFCPKFKTAASGADLPPDQQIYVGPFALDPDAMAIARKVEQSMTSDTVTTSINNMFDRIKQFIADDNKSKTHLLAPAKGKPGPDDYYLTNALRNEMVLEQQEPLYGVFRDYYRSEMIAEYYAKAEKKDAWAPVTLDSIDIEFFAEDNRSSWQPTAPGAPQRVPPADPRDDRETALRTDFIEQILGDDPVEFSELSDARLAQPSRLAFRVNCAPAPGATAEDAGLNYSSGASSRAPNSGQFTYPELAFTFAALTDWSRHEPAVTLRARKLFTGNASGIVPPIGARAANLADGDVLAYQGITRGGVTAEQRLGEIRATLAKKPTPYETAIEIPARLTLSTAQDAIWFDKRKLPWEVVHEKAGSVPAAAPVESTGGETVMKPGESVRRSHQPLWIARLALDGLEPNLRIVDSPDLRPNALTWFKPGDVRQIGQGVPPRGPLAPWFIGPEQMDEATLTAAGVNAQLPPGAQIPTPNPPPGPTPPPASEAELCNPPLRDRIWRILRLLCGRDSDRGDLGQLQLFRSALDAYDRHELVLLSSAYGLPVIGKRQVRAGDPSDSEQAGGLVTNSGQIEPGDEFPVLDADNAQAIQRPQQLRVRELWLSALGGSLIHDTQFLPSAGANDLWGGKIFDGFSIERWRAEIVLGRDIVGEVVYKGYLFPLGHRASLVKLTERLFLRSETLGVKAVLVQRIFVRVGRKVQAYPAVGQPFEGRLWCARNVTMLTVQTPDLQDPYENPKNPTANPENPVGGRVSLGGKPGLAFWPRVNETDEGLVKFDFTIDGAETSMPLIFVDNIAATNGESLQVLVETYRRWDPWKGARRTATLRDQNIRYAQETKTGDCTFKTQSLVVSVHGRLKTLGSQWNGDLTAYDTTAILEGAEQPPFYPSVETATVRLENVERFSGGAPRPVNVQYDGRYVRFGFPAKATDPTQQTNPLEVFLNLRTCVAMGMGNNGDRSGAVGRPESNIVAIGRGNGPIGASGAVIYEKSAATSSNDHSGSDQLTVPVCDKGPLIAGPALDPRFHDLVSLADFFDPQNPYLDQVKGAGVTCGPAGSAGTPSFPTTGHPAAPAHAAGAAAFGGGAADAIRKVLSTFFSDSAKILGVVTFRDLLQFLGFDTASLLGSTPVLRETLQFGSDVLDGAAADAQALVQDIHAHVLAPLQDVVQKLKAQWKAAGDTVKNQLPGQTPLSLAQVFPEIDSGLNDLSDKLATAQADNDPVGLLLDLSAVYESARTFAAALDRIASNPVARLQAAAVGAVQDLLAKFLQSTTVFGQGLAQIGENLPGILNADAIGAWFKGLVQSLDPTGQLIGDTLTLTLAPPDLVTLAEQTATGIGASFAAINDQLKKDLALDISDFAKAIVVDVLAGKKIGPTLKDLQGVVAGQVNQAVTNAKAALDAQAGVAQQRAVFILEAELDAFAGAMAQNLDASTNYSAALQQVVSAVTFIFKLIAAVKQLRDDITGGKIDKSLDDLALLSNMVLGVGGGTPFAQMDQILSGAFNGLQGQLAQLIAAPSPAFTAEIDACKAYQALDAAHQKKAVPTPTTPASDEPMKTLDAFLAALTKAQTAVDAVAGLVLDPTNLSEIQTKGGAAVTPYVNAIRGARTLMYGDTDPTDLGLMGDASKLYCAFVAGLARMSAAVKLIPTTPWTKVDKNLVVQLTRYEQACAQSAKEIGDALASAITRLTGFFTANPTIGRAALFTGALVGIAQIAGLSISSQVQPLADDWTNKEKDVVDALTKAINVLIDFLKKGGAFANAVATALGNALAPLDPLFKTFGVNLEPQEQELKDALKNLGQVFSSFANYVTITSGPTTIAGLLATPVVPAGNTPNVQSLFTGTPAQTYKQLSADLHNSEAAAFAAWRALQARATGLPQYLQRAVIVAAQAPLQKLSAVYGNLLVARNKAADGINSPLLSLQARRSLFVAPVYNSPPGVDVNDPTDNDAILQALETKDRLAEEVGVLTQIAADQPMAPSDKTVGDFVRFIDSWKNNQAAPLQIAANVQSLAAEVLKGDILALIDVAAFRDAILDAIAQLVPTKAVFSYDFGSTVTEAPDTDAIFQAQLGSRFVLTTKVEVDLLNGGKTVFTATGSLGPFAIKLVGSLIDAVTLRFGGASFEASNGAAPRFHVSYDSYEIGPALQFVQELESYLTPKDGAGFHIGPLDWALGIEVGYGINLGSISLGEVSFFNIIFDVSADLPFTNDGALFKTSLSTRLTPFTISILPYAGSGYFSIYSAADGIRGFEASFLFGGGGSLSFGPLEAQVQIQVGAFIKILKVGNVNTTEIAGTFLAAGSMTIWIFNFAATLYVSLGQDNAGHMYGEAIFTFSFSAGFIDYSYSVTASHDQPALGKSNGGGASELEPGLQPFTRFAALRDRNILTDAVDELMVAATVPSAKRPPAKYAPAKEQTDDVVSKAICQSEDWEKYASYFDFNLVQ